MSERCINLKGDKEIDKNDRCSKGEVFSTDVPIYGENFQNTICSSPIDTSILVHVVTDTDFLNITPKGDMNKKNNSNVTPINTGALSDDKNGTCTNLEAFSEDTKGADQYNAPSNFNPEAEFVNLNEITMEEKLENTINSSSGSEAFSDNPTKMFKYKIAQLNLNGWNANNGVLREKILLQSDADFITVNETHLKGNECPALQGYQWIGFNRKLQHKNAVRAFGGVGLFVKQAISEDFSIKVIDKSYDGILATEFVQKQSGFKMVFITCYLPPEHSKWGRDSTSFFGHITNEIYKYEEVDLIIVTGDVNARIGKKADYIQNVDSIRERKCIDHTTNQHGNALIEFLQETRLCVLNGRFDESNDGCTSVSSKGTAVVDYIICPIDKLDVFENFKVETCIDIVKRCKLQHLLSSKCKTPDHALLTCDFYIVTKPFQSEHVEHTTVRNKQKYKLNKIPNDFLNDENAAQNIEKYCNDILLSRESQEEIDGLYDSFCELVITEMDTKLPKVNTIPKLKKMYKPKKSFWNDELSILYRKVVEKERELRKCKFRAHKRDLRNEYKCARNRFDKTYRKHERSYNRGQMLKIEDVCTANPNEFWSHIKNLGPFKKNNIPMEVYSQDNEIICDVKSVLDTWKTDFSNLYNESTRECNEGFEKEQKDYVQMKEERMLDPLYQSEQTMNSDLTLDEVKNAVYKTKNKKAVGVDVLPNEVLKNNSIVVILHALFQLCFDTGKIPRIWRRAIIKPLPKSSENDPRIPLNYRGISLLSCTAKIFTSILNSRIVNFLTEQDVLADEQNGFRANRSCADHIYGLHSIAKMRQEQNKNTFVTFIDFSKAFDCIKRDSLFYKLLQTEIDGKMFTMIKSLYSLTESCISINDNLTDWFVTLQGVRQGDNLSPTLFILFINDLVKGLKELDLGIKIGEMKVPILLYADDVAILSENEKDMQSMLNFINNWCKTWSLSVNISKTKVMHIRKKNRESSNFIFKLGKDIVEYVKDYKYLGVYFDEFLDFSKHEQIIADSGRRALGALIAKYRTMDNMGFNTYSKCFETSICPILDYGAEIWGYKKCEQIDSVQMKAMKVFLGVHRFAANLAVLGDMGWLPTEIRRKICMIRYWNRLIKLEDNRLTKKLFNFEFDQNKGKWCKSIKTILQEIGLSDFYENQLTCDVKYCREKLMDKFKEKWKTEVIKKPKLRTYVQLKPSCGTENYVQLNLDRNNRSVLAQFRCGILPLHVETGRYSNTKLEDRKCTLCNSGEIEDEYHFIFHCNVYENEREEFFNTLGIFQNFINLTDPNKCKTLNELEPRKVARFLTKIIKKRQEQLYGT
jgi:exonuclease III